MVPAPGPTGNELIEVSRSFSLLCQPMFIMTTDPGDGGMGPVMANMESHLAYWAEMERKKVMFAAGPVMPADSADPWSGQGMVIFRAPSLSAARAIAAADPMHGAGAREYDLRPWLLNHLIPDGAPGA